MINLDPGWFEAGGADIAAFKIGVDMLKHKKNEEPAAPVAATATPAVAVPAFSGITGTEFLLGMVILALALLGTALIIHNGLTA